MGSSKAMSRVPPFKMPSLPLVPSLESLFASGSSKRSRNSKYIQSCATPALRPPLPQLSSNPTTSNISWTENGYTRVWTFQEIILASNPVILCGDESITWTELQQGLDCLSCLRPTFLLR
ncbi:hypothetical protein QBC45DRAFT_434513 [Copromyces sp. CBS 386.78]|nr:hypothetical protein QBC45DRAFT_434513 [Copromyces sp. CBS 386.78]